MPRDDQGARGETVGRSADLQSSASKGGGVSAHTPGPWREGPTEGIGQKGRLIVVDAAGHKIADCEAEKFPGSINFTRSLSEDTANVRLIIAAPELLAALRAIVYVAPENPFSLRDPRYGHWPKMVESARTAIAKAEGADA